MVRPNLDYASSTPTKHLDYKCDIRRLEGVHTAAARFCTSDYRHTSSVKTMLDSLGLEPLETRRKFGRLILLVMMYKIIHGLVDMNVLNNLQFSRETQTPNSHVFKF